MPIAMVVDVPVRGDVKVKKERVVASDGRSAVIRKYDDLRSKAFDAAEYAELVDHYLVKATVTRTQGRESSTRRGTLRVTERHITRRRIDAYSPACRDKLMGLWKRTKQQSTAGRNTADTASKDLLGFLRCLRECDKHVNAPLPQDLESEPDAEVLQLEEGAKERPIAIPDEEIDVDKYIIECMIMKVVKEEPREPVVKQEPTDSGQVVPYKKSDIDYALRHGYLTKLHPSDEQFTKISPEEESATPEPLKRKYSSNNWPSDQPPSQTPGTASKKKCSSTASHTQTGRSDDASLPSEPKVKECTSISSGAAARGESSDDSECDMPVEPKRLSERQQMAEAPRLSRSGQTSSYGHLL